MTGKPVGMPIAHPVPFLGRGEEDVGATVVGLVDALHPGVGDEDARHLVVGDVSEQLVDAATPPGLAGGEEVAVGAELRVGIVLPSRLCQYPVTGCVDGTSASFVQRGVVIAWLRAHQDRRCTLSKHLDPKLNADLVQSGPHSGADQGRMMLVATGGGSRPAT